jgi:homoserine O-acetyltransferase/O-succinyltransferase
MKILVRMIALVIAFLPLLVPLLVLGQGSPNYPITEGDYVAHNFKFRSGEQMTELRLHYRTLGKPARDASGKITNAVLILHGTTGSGTQFLAPYFAAELYNPGHRSTSANISSSLPMALGTVNRPSLATACTRTSHNMIMTIWCWRST